MGKGNHASNIRKIGKSYETDLTKPNIEEGGKLQIPRPSRKRSTNTFESLSV